MNDFRNYKRISYKATDISYLAGIIDGEGSIYIGNFSCNKTTKLPYYQTNIQVANTDKRLIDWLKETFGGLVNTRTRKQTPINSRKTVYMWTISGDRLTHICEEILPYLICKKRQAEIMLKMRATFETGSPNRLSLETRHLRESLMNEMRSLHIRTHSYKNKGPLPRITIDHPDL